MPIPTFNIPYIEAHSTSIEFMTQINEKMKGREQRYPVWTYPKRTFSLKFEKNKAGREALEAFFADVMGKGGNFNFIWEDKTYLCNFDSDSLQQNLKEQGFGTTELKLVAIDDTATTQVDELDFYHSAECDGSIEFSTLIDKIFTAQNNRKSYWDAPKRSWTLSFEKNKTVRKELEAFFMAKRGRFRSFDWQWKTEHGGDGNTYHVRFDTDTLDVDVLEYGYGTLQLKLKEVFPNTNPLTEWDKDEIIPRKLLKLELEGGSVFVLDNETLQNLTYNGDNYLGAPLEHGEIKKDDNSAVNKLNIKISNVALAISGIIGVRGDVITNAPAVLTTVLLNLNTNEIIEGSQTVLYAGRCNNVTLDYENASMDIETDLGGFELQAPVMRYRTSCQVRRFKDIRCAYAGTETTCDRTFARCEELGNTLNFRGFPSIPAETIIKV